jgi:molybdopterin/thiamine biosynthesis adenylyltransferase
MKTHDCYKCIFKQQLPSHHISCKLIEHPLEVAALVVSQKRFPFIAKIDGVETELIEINPHGIENGWATYPIDFDPIWIDKCLFYKENESSNTNSNN